MIQRVQDSMRILIAEDDATSRKILAGYLKRWGYEVIPTADGHEAWEVLSGPDCPQLVILDWEMPGIDGDELCRRFRELDLGYYVYMVLLTGKDLKEEVVAGLGLVRMIILRSHLTHWSYVTAQGWFENPES